MINLFEHVRSLFEHFEQTWNEEHRHSKFFFFFFLMNKFLLPDFQCKKLFLVFKNVFIEVKGDETN